MSEMRRADLAYLNTLQGNLGSAISQTQDLISLMQNALAPAGDGLSSQAWAGPDAQSFIALWEGTFKRNLDAMSAAFDQTQSNLANHTANYEVQTAAKFVVA